MNWTDSALTRMSCGILVVVVIAACGGCGSVASARNSARAPGKSSAQFIARTGAGCNILTFSEFRKLVDVPGAVSLAEVSSTKIEGEPYTWLIARLANGKYATWIVDDVDNPGLVYAGTGEAPTVTPDLPVSPVVSSLSAGQISFLNGCTAPQP